MNTSLLLRRCFSTAPGSKKLAFVGLGNMGLNMACNISKKAPEFKLHGYDPQVTSSELLKNAGGECTPTLEAAVQDADVVITMLPSNKHVKQVYETVFSMNLGPDCLCIDSSTIDPAVSREMAKQAATRGGARFVDAPVSGGVGGAEKGTLTFMVGGSNEDFDVSSKVLTHMGANIVHCGDIGTGQVAKLCNNLILAISMIGVSEAMNLGDKLGIDQKVLAGILNTSTARCWSSDTYNPAPGVMEGVPSSNNYNGGFGAALMLKDLGLVTDAAKGIDVPLPLGSHAHSLYQLLISKGLGSKDFSVVYEFLSKKD